MNVVILIGRLTRDVELQYLPSGTAVVKGSIVTNRNTKVNDKWETVPDYHDFKVFGSKAEYIQRYSNKGDRISIKGELRKDTWVAQDGTNRYNVYVFVNEVELLSCKNKNNEGNTNNQQNYNNNSYAAPTNNAPSETVPEIDIDDEDIPF